MTYPNSQPYLQPSQAITENVTSHNSDNMHLYSHYRFTFSELVDNHNTDFTHDNLNLQAVEPIPENNADVPMHEAEDQNQPEYQQLPSFEALMRDIGILNAQMDAEEVQQDRPRYQQLPSVYEFDPQNPDIPLYEEAQQNPIDDPFEEWFHQNIVENGNIEDVPMYEAEDQDRPEEVQQNPIDNVFIFQVL